jgi:hypothetical protein
MQTTGSNREDGMDTLTPLLAVITGFALRLAIPIGITAIAIYFLRIMDTRWQAEAKEQLLQPVVEKTKCWEINGCTPEMQANCAGYQSEQPCWQAFREENGYLQERCLGCDVFQQAPIPVNI